MTMYHAHLELDVKNVTEDLAEAVLDHLPDYHATVGQSPRRHLSVRITFPAETLLQAVTTAVSVIETAAGARTIYSEVMTEVEFDGRQGFTHVPELVGATEAAQILGKSRMRVNQMIEEGKFSTALRVGKTWAIARDEVEAMTK